MSGYERPFVIEEYETRQANAIEAATESGFDALLVWSRGGGMVDRYSNALYLANAYSSFPFVPDNLPSWSGRAHAVVLLPVADATELLIDFPYYDEEGVAIDQVRVNPDMLTGVAEMLREHGLASGRIGLVGDDVLPVSWFWKLQESLPDVQWSSATHILDDLRRIKSPAERDVIREASANGVEVMKDLLAAVQPGMTEGDAAGAGLRSIATHGMMLYEMQIAGGLDAHQYTRPRLPSWDIQRPLEPGDMFHVDLMASYKGYYTDFARTVVVGDVPPTEDQARLMHAARDSVYAVIEAIHPGVSSRELAMAGYRVLDEYGLAGVSDVSQGGRSSGFEGFGHSLGLQWESPWLDTNSEVLIQAGMYLAIEKTVGIKGVGGATFEENVLVTDDGVDILTAAAPQGF